MHKSEGELRRAQRLEAMGTLARRHQNGFNNILGAILGLQARWRCAPEKEGTPLRRDLDAIMAAGERGRALVGRRPRLQPEQRSASEPR